MPLREWETEKTVSDGFDLSANPISLSPALRQVIRNASQFAQIEWKNDRWSVLFGTRLDENSAVKKAIFSPALPYATTPRRISTSALPMPRASVHLRSLTKTFTSGSSVVRHSV